MSMRVCVCYVCAMCVCVPCVCVFVFGVEKGKQCFKCGKGYGKINRLTSGNKKTVQVP